MNINVRRCKHCMDFILDEKFKVNCSDCQKELCPRCAKDSAKTKQCIRTKITQTFKRPTV